MKIGLETELTFTVPSKILEIFQILKWKCNERAGATTKKTTVMDYGE